MIRKIALVVLAIAAVSLWGIGWLSVYRTIFITAPVRTPPIRFIASGLSPDTIQAPPPLTTCEVRDGWLQFARSSTVRFPSPNTYHSLPLLYQYIGSSNAEVVALPAEVAQTLAKASSRQCNPFRYDWSSARIVRYTRWRALWLSPFSLALLLGAYPLVVVIRSYVRWVRLRRSGAVCRTCGYNLTGNVSGVCPECGTEIVRA